MVGSKRFKLVSRIYSYRHFESLISTLFNKFRYALVCLMKYLAQLIIKSLFECAVSKYFTTKIWNYEIALFSKRKIRQLLNIDQSKWSVIDAEFCVEQICRRFKVIQDQMIELRLKN